MVLNASSAQLTLEELPLWMRQAQRGVDWGILLALVLSLAAAWPFLFQTGLPRTYYGESIVYRTEDMATALSEGYLYPRWSPHVLQGYGAPIPHYYPPGAPYSAAVIQLLFTNDPVIAVRVLILLSFAIAGSAVYALVTRHAGSVCGFFACILYVYSPFMSSDLPAILGDVPALMSLAGIPALLWGLGRLALIHRPQDHLIVGVLSAALILVDPRGAVIGFCFGAAYVPWQAWNQRSSAVLRRCLLACLGGVGMAAFYWLPALAEQNLVSWIANPVPGPDFAIQFPDILTPMRQIDSGALIDTPQLTIGLIGAVLLAAGGFSVALRPKEWGFQTLFLFLGAMLLILLIFILPREIWLLGPVTLCIAVGSSRLLHYRASLPNPLRRIFLAAVSAVVLASAFPIWFTSPWSEEPIRTGADAQIRFEQLGYGPAVLPPGAYIPSTIPADLAPNRFLIAGYQNETINRFAPNQDAIRRASILVNDSQQMRFGVEARQPADILLLNAYFPGWQATFAGRSVDVRQDEESGLIRVNIPLTTSGELTVGLGTTPIRSEAWVLSGVVFFLMMAQMMRKLQSTESRYNDIDLLPLQDARLLSVVVVMFAGAIFFFNILPISPLRAQGDYALAGITRLGIRSDAGIELIGYRLNQVNFQPGDRIDFSLYWQASTTLTANYQARAYLQDTNVGAEWFRTPFHNPGHYPTRRWKRDLYLEDTYQMQISDSAVAGEYRLVIEIALCDPECRSSARPTFFDSGGAVLGQIVMLPNVITIQR